MRKKHVLIVGASGIVGQRVAETLLNDGFHVRSLTRSASPTGPHGIDAIQWNSADPSPDPSVVRAIDEADILINLAGSPIDEGRFDRKHKERIRKSRLDAIQALETYVSARAQPLSLWIQVSATGFYGDRGEEVLDERTGPGELFLSQVCVDYEERAREAAESSQTPMAILRLGVVLGRDAPAWKKMSLPIRIGAGGPIGDGQQWMSWVDARDVGPMFATVAASGKSGIWNATAPSPIRQVDMVRIAANLLGRPSFVPTPIWAVRLAVGKLADELLLPSCRAMPGRFLEEDFPFQGPDFSETAAYLLGEP